MLPKTAPPQHMLVAGVLALAAALGLLYFWVVLPPSQSFPLCVPSPASSEASAPSAGCPPCPTRDKPLRVSVSCPITSCPACPAVRCAACPPLPAATPRPKDPSTGALEAELKKLQSANARLQSEKQRLTSTNERLTSENQRLTSTNERLASENMELKRNLNVTSWDFAALSAGAVRSAKSLLGDCNKGVGAATVTGTKGEITSWKGYQCRATDADMARYLNYTPRALCPQDWYFVQKLIFSKDCLALPRRRCFAVTPARPKEPMPFPASLFDQKALMDSNVRWDLHQCKSFECLLTRKGWADCLLCFNMTHEAGHFFSNWQGALSIADIIKLKGGSLRIGLDVGGATGTFAAHMARHNVTVITTAWNLETLPNYQGLPYMETIALRGLIPLHLPHQARLPLYDGTLDFIHAESTIKRRPLLEFEEMLFEWDRVLRVGGIIWLNLFYAPVPLMPLYEGVLEMLGYKKLHWNHTPKPHMGINEPPSIYLNCVLEKPARPGTEVLNGPPKEDTSYSGLFTYVAPQK